MRATQIHSFKVGSKYSFQNLTICLNLARIPGSLSPMAGHSTPPAYKRTLSPKTNAVHPALRAFAQTAFRLGDSSNILERPISGTILYLATCMLELKYGTFTVHTFQDIIHKGYALALTYGDLSGEQALHCRIHSSCVTSETLMGCDCDCAEQLDSALKTIVEAGRGVLFYLIQEGRGVGYLGKSRDRMLVQASQDEISTFEAYHILGLNNDYRHYSNIIPICHILGIKTKFILLTNNLDKVHAIKELGAEVTATEALEIPPTPYNLTYLASKQRAGHLLKKPQKSHLKRVSPPEVVIPFKPYALPEAQRFVYVASYFLPIKPVKGEIILEERAFREAFSKRPIDAFMGDKDALILDYKILPEHRFLIKINTDSLLKHQAEHPEDPLLTKLTCPYWFRVHVYTDIVSSEDFVVLSYGHIKAQDRPIVRLHSESIFNRFPGNDLSNKDKFNASIQHIVHYGKGILILLYNDGRGAGFGAYAEDRMLEEHGLSHNTDESYNHLGISYDRRDYHAAMLLLKHHLPAGPIQMIFQDPSNLIRKKDCLEALEAHQIEVDRWIFLNEPH